jgi:hypothetical protein
LFTSNLGISPGIPQLAPLIDRADAEDIMDGVHFADDGGSPPNSGLPYSSRGFKRFVLLCALLGGFDAAVLSSPFVAVVVEGRRSTTFDDGAGWGTLDVEGTTAVVGGSVPDGGFPIPFASTQLGSPVVGTSFAMHTAGEVVGGFHGLLDNLCNSGTSDSLSGGTVTVGRAPSLASLSTVPLFDIFPFYSSLPLSSKDFLFPPVFDVPYRGAHCIFLMPSRIRWQPIS